MAKMKIGVIGLGQMGEGIAKNVVKAGFDTVVYDLRKEPLEELQKLGAKIAGSSKSVGSVSDVVITVVWDDAQTNQVILGEEGLLQGMKGGAIIIASLVSPSCVKAIALEAKKKNVDVLDASISGGPMAANAGTLTIMVGGSEHIFQQYRTVLEVLGKDIFYCGNLGKGLVAKLALNMISHNTLVAISEALALGVKAGVDKDLLLNIFRKGAARCWVLEHWDWFDELRRDLGPTSRVRTLHKDHRLALDLAIEHKVPTPMTSLCYGLDLYIRE